MSFWLCIYNKRCVPMGSLLTLVVAMTLTLLLRMTLALGFLSSVRCFAVAPPTSLRTSGRHSWSGCNSGANQPTWSSFMMRRNLRGRSDRIMTRMTGGGFGAKKEKEPPRVQGAGRGQRAYQRQVESFNGLRSAGAEAVDVYVTRVRDDDDRFIFAGKVAWTSGLRVEQALQWQRDLILDHVKLLEPAWKAKPVAPMRIFTAPVDSEVDVARNVHDLTWVLGGKGAVNTDGITNQEVGLRPELYERGEAYYYVRKLADGRCPAPPADVNVESVENLVAAGLVTEAGGDVQDAPPAPAE